MEHFHDEIHSHMLTMETGVVRQNSTQEGDPDEQKAAGFLRPGKTRTEDIAQNYVHDDQAGHQRTREDQNNLNKCHQSIIDFFQNIHVFAILSFFIYDSRKAANQRESAYPQVASTSACTADRLHMNTGCPFTATPQRRSSNS